MRARLAVLIAVVLTFIHVPAQAAALLQLQPVRLTLPANGHAGKLNIINKSPQRAVLQARVYAWSQAPDGTDRLEPTSDVVFTPPIMTIEPDGTQTLRLAQRHGPRAGAASERTFRMALEELPSTTDGAGLTLRLRYLVPVFVGGEDGRAGPVNLQLAGTGTGCRITLANEGTRHVSVRKLEGRADDETLEVSAPLYVLAGARISLPCPRALQERRKIEQLRLETDAGIFTGARDTADPRQP
jgi:fimbrial chaperone protein